MKPRDEQKYSAICHFFNAIPIWGLVVSGIVWFDSREKSRHLMAQTQQAMSFHGLLLVAIVTWMMIEIGIRLLSNLLIPIGEFSIAIQAMQAFALAVLAVTTAVYAAVCLWGSWNCASGKTFYYPLVSPRRNGSEPRS